jgi:hypothetical protein
MAVHDPTVGVPSDLLVVLPAAPHSDDAAAKSVSFYDELLAAAGRHERSDARSRGIWHEVLTCLRLTALARQLETTDDAGAQAVAVSYALSAGRRASMAMQRRLRRGQRRCERTLGVRYAPRVGSSIERTSLRLTGLLLGAAPADLELVDAALASHNNALEEWRATLARRLRGH